MSSIRDQLLQEWHIDYEHFDKVIHRFVDDGFSELLPKSMRLHVSNIPFSCNERDLNIIFRIFGDVLHTEIIKNSRGSKGFGFVTMRTSDEAQQAKDVLDKCNLGGRIIDVNLATPRKFSSPSNSTAMTPTTPHLSSYRVCHNYQRSVSTPASSTPQFRKYQNVFCFPPPT